MRQEIYEVPKIKRAHPIEVSVPGSKSITNRALLIAALAEGKSVLSGVLFSDDSRHFLQALKDLGFEVDIDETKKRVSVVGCGGSIPKKEASVYVGSAGTAARFLTAFLGLSSGRYRMDASEQMKKRPMKELLVALEELGADVEYLEEAYHFPFVIGCPKKRAQEVTVDVEKSSQFLSALLISSVLSDGDFTVHVAGSHGMAYVDMTVRMMEQFGVTVDKPEENRSGENTFFTCFRIPKTAYKCRDYRIEPDVSAACYFYAMSPLLHVPATVTGVRRDSMQGDIRFLDILERMGCSSREGQNGITVYPPEDGLRGGSFDLSACSDQALTLAAIAPFADSAVAIRHVGHIRLQECDRIEAILHNLCSMGISCTEEEGTVTIAPGQVKPCEVETYDDHRVAMAFAVTGLAAGGIQIKNPACCKKTFENYFEVLEERVLRA